MSINFVRTPPHQIGFWIDRCPDGGCGGLIFHVGLKPNQEYRAYDGEQSADYGHDDGGEVDHDWTFPAMKLLTRWTAPAPAA